MDLSIIIVNYNNYLLTINCINSVIKNVTNINYEIILIDNNSTNNSFELLTEEYKSKKNVQVIKSNKNLGFGGANNEAVKIAKGDYILILNPDIITFDNSIEKMYKRILNDKNIGLIGCKLLNEDKTLQYSCRRFIRFTEFILARTPIKKIVPKNYSKRINSYYLMKDYDHEHEKDVDWVMGSCMMIKKDYFQKIGGFSPQYFMYFEDVDLCYKVKSYGKRVVYSPYYEIIHLHRQESTKSLNKLSFVHFISMIKFYLFKRYN